jgi:N-formylglutamate amidohydrolase
MRIIKDALAAPKLSKFPMPVLFTCPHGGRGKLKETPKRDISNLPIPPCSKKKFSIKKDRRTKELTQKIIENIVSLGRRQVYKQLADVHRAYVDLNRIPKCAFEPSKDHISEQVYNNYHNSISDTITKMYTQNETGLRFLFDIHGTDETEVLDDGSTVKVDVFFGTDKKHTNTICGLLQINPNALWDDNTGLIKLLQDKGYSTFPQRIDQDEFYKLDGGTTIRKYGGCNVKKRVEAIQIEVGPRYRLNDDLREQFSRDIAECIFNFVSAYRPELKHHRQSAGS